jgi:hypothetical protein
MNVISMLVKRAIFSNMEDGTGEILLKSKVLRVTHSGRNQVKI